MDVNLELEISDLRDRLRDMRIERDAAIRERDEARERVTDCEEAISRLVEDKAVLEAERDEARAKLDEREEAARCLYRDVKTNTTILHGLEVKTLRRWPWLEE